MKNRTNINEKRIRLTTLWPAIALTFLAAWAAPMTFAQGAKLDLSHLDKLAKNASDVKTVNVDGAMLQQIGKSQLNLTGPAGDFKDIAGCLKGVYVRKYEFDKPGEYSKADVENLMKQLSSKGWVPLAKDEDKKTGEIKGVYMFNKGGETEGMAVIKASPKELSVVNIVGPINISSLEGHREHSSDSKPELQHRPETTPKGKDSSE
jgi:Domain of unknown function (DUF4252)